MWMQTSTLHSVFTDGWMQSASSGSNPAPLDGSLTIEILGWWMRPGNCCLVEGELRRQGRKKKQSLLKWCQPEKRHLCIKRLTIHPKGGLTHTVPLMKNQGVSTLRHHHRIVWLGVDITIILQTPKPSPSAMYNSGFWLTNTPLCI